MTATTRRWCPACNRMRTHLTTGRCVMADHHQTATVEPSGSGGPGEDRYGVRAPAAVPVAAADRTPLSPSPGTSQEQQ